MAESIAWRIAKRTGGNGAVKHVEDLRQEAAIGIMKAMERFDASLGTDVRTFAWHYGMGEARHYMRDRFALVQTPRRLRESGFRLDILHLADFKIGASRSHDDPEEWEVPSIEDGYEVVELMDAVRRSLRSEEERRFVMAVVMGESQSEIGEAVGMEQTNVSKRFRNRIRPALRRALAS